MRWEATLNPSCIWIGRRLTAGTSAAAAAPWQERYYVARGAEGLRPAVPRRREGEVPSGYGLLSRTVTLPLTFMQAAFATACD